MPIMCCAVCVGFFWGERMTKPTNVLLGSSLHAMAKNRAQERGLSLSGYIRELIRADDAASRNLTGDITPLVGFLGSRGAPTDIARNKHEMITEAVAEQSDRKAIGARDR